MGRGSCQINGTEYHCCIDTVLYQTPFVGHGMLKFNRPIFLDPECLCVRDFQESLFFRLSVRMSVHPKRNLMLGIYKRRALVPCNFWFEKFFLKGFYSKIRLISDIETLIRQLAQLSITLRYHVLRSEIHLHIQRNQNFWIDSVL